MREPRELPEVKNSSGAKSATAETIPRSAGGDALPVSELAYTLEVAELSRCQSRSNGGKTSLGDALEAQPRGVVAPSEVRNHRGPVFRRQ